MNRQQIEIYITKNYKDLLNCAKFITKNDTAGDLLHDVTIYLLTRKTYSSKLNNCTNLYNYINKAMIISHFSNNSVYSYNYMRYLPLDIDRIMNEPDEDVDTTYEEIINWVQKTNLFNNRKKNFICKTIFTDYFNPEVQCQISGMTINQVEKIRRTSHQKIANKHDISKSSVRNAIIEVVIKIKKNYII